MASPTKSGSPTSPSTIEKSDLPWRKKVPFNLVGRGVAGVDEMSEYLEDSKVYFGLIAIEIGSGSFKRNKSIFVHFNGEKHPKPLQRAKANKKMNAAKKLLSPYHAEIVLENTKNCSIDYVFHRLGHIFVSDTAVKGTSKFEIGSLKEEYKRKMKEARKKAKAEKERLEKQRQKLLAQQEEERRLIDEAKRRAEEEERKRKEAEEEERRRQEEEERKAREAAEAAQKAETLRLEQEKAEQQRVKAEEEAARRQKKEEEEAAKKKKRRSRKRRRKKDDWSDEREWSGERIVACIHAQTSPMNWAVFKPSSKEIIPMAFGHGDLNDLRAALKPDQMQYGIMRLTFGEGRFRRSHWIFVVWSPDSMTKVDSQKLKKKRMSARMVNIGHKGWMQKAIGPYGVEVMAESYDYVSLEDWILRVRRTVVVDGTDELMNADAFNKALQAEKAHFNEMKAKKEEARRKKEELERKLNEEETSSEEELYDEDLAKKNKKKRKRKKKKDGDEEDAEDNEDNEEDGDNEEDDGGEDKKDDVVDEKEGNDNVENVEGNEEESKEGNIDEKKTDLLSVDTSQLEQSKKRKSSIDPSVLKARDVSSQLCFESITLIKRPDTDLVWVLIEPRLKRRR